VLNMKPPRNIKEVQRLNGCIAALGYFKSKSADKCQPFFCVLQRRANFVWNREVDDLPVLEGIPGPPTQCSQPRPRWDGPLLSSRLGIGCECSPGSGTG